MRRYKPLYGCPGLLYDCETGSLVRMVRGEKKPVKTFFVNGEECLTLSNGKPIRVKSLLKGGREK
jgi:hypothetical protein